MGDTELTGRRARRRFAPLVATTNADEVAAEVAVVCGLSGWELIAARRLHASVYTSLGYAHAADISPDGTLGPNADPYVGRSTYFGAFANAGTTPRLLATARHIRPDPYIGHESLPTFSQLPIESGARVDIERVDPYATVEVSALAKVPHAPSHTVLALYWAMWRHSVARGDALWLMACDAALFRQLRSLIGHAVTRIGPAVYYKGHTVIPSTLTVNAVADVSSNVPSAEAIGRVYRRRVPGAGQAGGRGQRLSPGTPP